MAEKYIENIISQVNINLDSYLRNMRQVSDTMYYRIIKNTDFAADNIDNYMGMLYDANKDSLVSIAVFEENGDLVSTAPLSRLKKGINIKENPWFDEALKKIENMHFSTPHIQNLFNNPDYPYRRVISLSRAAELTKNGVVHHGVLLVDMNLSGIERIFSSVRLGDSGYLFLISREGTIIYHPKQQLIYSGLFKENNLQIADYDEGTHEELFQGQKRIVTVKSVGYTGWKIVGISTIQDITSNYQNIPVFACFVLLFSFFLTILINQFVSSKIADPIKKLEQSVKILEEGNLDADINIGGSYEIRHLGEAIQSMAVQMRKLMSDIVIQQEAKRKSELDALQSQINPHFLYNTLDSIVWMIESKRVSEAVKMVTSLARLFRISLSKGNNIISIQDELEHAQHYLTIQMFRYQNKFTVRFDTQPDVLKYATAKLIVQPLLENAIYHGMALMDGDGEIVVKTYCDETDLYIDVIDNGDGIPSNICKDLLLDTQTNHKKGSGIGLNNVHKRIQLCFGEEYGLAVLSRLGYGTTVRIKLPRKEFIPKTGEDNNEK
jgi:two-component system sensor histidine kinase YesM